MEGGEDHHIENVCRVQYFYCSNTTYLSILDTIFFNEIQRTSIVIVKILCSVSKVKNKVKKAETRKARVKTKDKCGKKDNAFTRMKLIYLEIILIRHETFYIVLAPPLISGGVYNYCCNESCNNILDISILDIQYRKLNINRQQTEIFFFACVDRERDRTVPP